MNEKQCLSGLNYRNQGFIISDYADRIGHTQHLVRFFIGGHISLYFVTCVHETEMFLMVIR